MEDINLLNPASSTLECGFSNPVLSDGSPASSTPDLPWQFASSSCAIAFNATSGTSTPVIVNTISGGELVVATELFAFLMFALLFTFTIWRRGVRIRQ